MSNRKSKRRWQDDEEKALEDLLFSKDKVIENSYNNDVDNNNAKSTVTNAAVWEDEDDDRIQIDLSKTGIIIRTIIIIILSSITLLTLQLIDTNSYNLDRLRKLIKSDSSVVTGKII